MLLRQKKQPAFLSRQIKKGDKIVVGENGIRIIPPERPREGMNAFQFMGSGSSSERPTQHIAKKVAEDIRRTKKGGGKIVLVGGPAIIHTGAAESVSALIHSWIYRCSFGWKCTCSS